MDGRRGVRSFAIQDLLSSFDRLTEKEQREAAVEILRRTPGLELPFLDDVETIDRIAVESFLEYDARERVEPMNLTIEIEQEEDGRWIAEVMEIPGVLVYGQTREDAITQAQSLTLRVLADRLEHGEGVPELDNLFTVVA